MSKQAELAGFEAPKNADIEAALDAWLEAKDEQKYATDKTKLRHAGLLTVMSNSGVESYAFVDPKTGKKQLLVVARDPKAKTTKAPRWNRRDKDAEDDVGDEVEVQDLNDDTPPVDNVVEMRRVKRSSVEKEIDPFASTRKALDDDHAASAELDAIGGTYAEKMAQAFPEKKPSNDAHLLPGEKVDFDKPKKKRGKKS